MSVHSRLVIDFKKRIITDHELIRKYNEEFGYRFFQPSVEDNWLDPDIVTQNVYSDSRESINYTFNPIYVAVNDKDEKIDDPVERIHGRLIDGRQRYADSKKSKKPWDVVYVYIKNYQEYLMVIATMGSKKNPEVQGQQTRSIIRSFCESVWKSKPKEINGTDGFPDKQNVSQYVKKVFSKRWSERTIEKAIPSEYKNQVKVDAAMQGVKQQKPKSKIKQENITLKQENDRLMKYTDELERRVLPETKKDEVIKNQDTTIKQMKITIGIIKSDLRTARRKAGIDKTDKEFKLFWESIATENRMYLE